MALSLRQVVFWSLVAAVGLRVGIRQAVARRVVLPGTLPNISLLGGALLVSFLAADLAVAAYLGVTAPPPDLPPSRSSSPS